LMWTPRIRQNFRCSHQFFCYSPISLRNIITPTYLKIKNLVKSPPQTIA